MKNLQVFPPEKKYYLVQIVSLSCRKKAILQYKTMLPGIYASIALR